MGLSGLREELGHVLWLGGSPCSGKSSISRILAKSYGLRAYHCDEAFGEHQQRLSQALQPTLHKWTTTDWDDLWMQSPDVLLAEAIAAYREHFGLVVADLLALPRGAPMLAEGTCLLPNLVAEMLHTPHQAMWLVPTEAFQRRYYPQRGSWVQDIVTACRDPQQALENWMARDVAFARWVTDQTLQLGLKHIVVDGSLSIEENARLVAEHLDLVASSV
jgi:hypothetical protein